MSTYDQLWQMQKDREDMHRAEKRLVNQMKARLRRQAQLSCPNADNHPFICSRCVALSQKWFSASEGDPLPHPLLNGPLLTALAPLHETRLNIEREMTNLAKSLPVAPFVERTRGFGYFGLAQIAAETGGLHQYANPAKVWKRMGLAVFDGKSQRKVMGEAAIAQGYSPRRRSIMFVIGDSLVKQGEGYRALYLERKEYEKEKAADLQPIVYHRRAQRYMEKRLLRDLWEEWRVAA